MFDFDAGKLIIVGVVALIFIPTKDLPRVLRQVGQFVGRMRRLATDFQGQFMDAMRDADMADLRQEAQKLSDAARMSSGLDALHQGALNGAHDLDRQMVGQLDAPPVVTAIPSEHGRPGELAPATQQLKEPVAHAVEHAESHAEASVGHPA